MYHNAKYKKKKKKKTPKDLNDFEILKILTQNLNTNKSISNDCVIPRHCKQFHLPIFSKRFIFSINPEQGS